MIWSSYQAIKTMIVTVSLMVGVVNFSYSPIMLPHHSCYDPVCSAPGSHEIETVHQLPNSEADFSLSLEWTLFNPTGGHCETKVHDSHDRNDSTSVTDPVTMSQLDFISSLYRHDDLFLCPLCINELTPQNNSSHLIIDPISVDEDTPDSLPSADTTPFLQPLLGRFDYSPQPSLPILNPRLVPSNIDPPALVTIELSSEEDCLSPSPTLSVKEHLPKPGSDSGVLFYHGQLQAFIRSIVFSTLPGPWAEWIVSNQPMIGITCVTGLYGFLLLLLLVLLWRHKSSKQALANELRRTKRWFGMLEKKAVALKNEKMHLLQKLSDASRTVHRLEDTNRVQKLEMDYMNKAGVHIEKQFCNASNSLSSANFKILKHEAEIKKLNDKLKDEREKLAKFSSKHCVALEKVADLVKEKGQLELKNDLILHAKETTINCLKTLQVKHDKVKRELKEAKEQVALKDLELSSMSDQLFSKEESLCEQEEEIEELRDSLSHVTNQTAELASIGLTITSDVTVEQKQGSVKWEDQSEKKRDTSEESQVNGELAKSTEDATTSYTELERTQYSLAKRIAEVEDLEDHVCFLEDSCSKQAKQLDETNLKMKAMVNCFKSREILLQKKLAMAERQLKETKLLDFEAQEKLIMSEGEMEEEREEWKDMKIQLLSMSTSLRYQLTVSNNRVEDVLTQCKQSEQELAQANKEIKELKSCLTSAEQTAGEYTPLPITKATTHLTGQYLSPHSPVSSLTSTQAEQHLLLSQTKSSTVPTSILKHPSSPCLPTSRSEPSVQSDSRMQKRVSFSLDRKYSSPDLSIPCSSPLSGALSGEPMPTGQTMTPLCVISLDKSDPISTQQALNETSKQETTPTKQNVATPIDVLFLYSGPTQPCNRWD